MSYRPKKRVTEFKANPAGKALIVLRPGKKLGVKFIDGDYVGKKYEVSDWPNFVKPKLLPDREWYVRLGNDEKSIFSLSPQSGMFTGVVKEFVSKEGEPPVPQLREYTFEGKPVQYYYFTVLVEIVDGDDACIGMLVPYTLRYYFGEDEDGLVEYTHFGKNSKHAPILDEFLTMVEAWEDGPITYSDNILPELQKRILRRSVKFQFIMKNGWIDTLYEAILSNKVSAKADPGWDETEEPPWDAQNPSDTVPEVKESEEFEW